MKIKVKYYSIQSDHILAVPAFSHSEIVEVSSYEKLDKYIKKQKDPYGHHYRKEKYLGFDYISNAGAVKVGLYKSPRVKKI